MNLHIRCLQLPEYALCTAYNHRMLVHNATTVVQLQMQLQHATTKMQLQNAATDYNYSMQVHNAGQGAGVCGADITPDMLHQSP